MTSAYWAAVDASPSGAAIRLKVVPGASHDAIVGPYGDRIRVKVAAPPEAGKANRAVCALVRTTLDVPRGAVVVTQGHGSPRKTVTVKDLPPAEVVRRLEAAR